MAKASGRTRTKKPNHGSSRPRTRRPKRDPIGSTAQTADKSTVRKKRPAGGSRSKRTGARYELEFIEELRKKNLTAERVPLSGAVGGRFGGDVMVWPSQIQSFSLEVKYRSTPNGLVKFLKVWTHEHEARPVRMGGYLIMRLEDFPQQLVLTDASQSLPILDQEPPALMCAWMRQAQSTFGLLAIRLPKRYLEHRWVIVIDASSEALLRQINWSNCATP